MRTDQEGGVTKATVESTAASGSQPKPLNTPRGLVHSIPSHVVVSLPEFQFSSENTETARVSNYQDSVVKQLGPLG